MKDEFGEEEREVLFIPAANIAWQMFNMSGLPGYYLLYKGITDDRSPLD